MDIYIVEMSELFTVPKSCSPTPYVGSSSARISERMKFSLEAEDAVTHLSSLVLRDLDNFFIPFSRQETPSISIIRL